MRIVRIFAVVLLSLSSAVGAYADVKVTSRSTRILTVGDSPSPLQAVDSQVGI